MSGLAERELALLYESARRDAPTGAKRLGAREALLRALATQHSPCCDDAQAVLGASRVPSIRQGRWRSAGAVISLAAAGVIVWFVSQSGSIGVVDVAPEAPASAVSEVRAVSVHRNFDKPIASAQVSRPEPSSSPGRPPQRPATARPSLSREIELLDEARSALSDGDSSAALEKLDDYELRLRGELMHDEAGLLRILALERAGRRSESRALALKFVEQNPNSPLVDRVRDLLGRHNDQQREPSDGEQP